MDQNFTYDVLEPVKVPRDPHRDVGILVDINDGDDKLTHLELSGSDLDNIKKVDFDLVDLYQNIYVTPQHVKKKFVEKPQIDYGEFSKLETGGKTDWTINSTVSKDYPDKPSINEIDSRHNGLLNENDDKTVKESPFNDSILKKYNITRVLKVPKIDGLKCTIDQDIQKKIESSIPFNVNNELDKNISTAQFETDETDNYTTGNGFSRNIEDFNKLKALFGTGTFNRPVNNIAESILEKPFENINLNNEPQISHNQNAPRYGKTAYNNYHPRTAMETVKVVTLDKKIYAKQLQVKTDKEKLGYTKGPGLYQKSIVLPQIAKRLAERKAALEEEAGLSRRLILESRKVECKCQCSQKIIPTDSANESNIRSRGFVLDKIKQASMQDIPLKNASSSSAYTSQNKGIKLNPILAFEDCNRERLIAHRVHSAFEKYVLSGSYY